MSEENKQTRTFLLDPKFLDNRIANIQNEEIEAKVAAYVVRENKLPRYAFYVDEVDVDNVPIQLLKLSRKEERSLSELRFTYRRAEVLFLPFIDTRRFHNGSALEACNTELDGVCEVLYASGDFKKGDATTFKRYGITLVVNEK